MSGGVEEQSSTATWQQLNTHGDNNMERTITGEAVAKGYPSSVAITSHDTITVMFMTEIQGNHTLAR